MDSDDTELRLFRLSFAGVRKSSSQLAGWIWISPWLFGFIVFLALPMAMSLYHSFTDYPLIERPVWIGLDNYKALFNDSLFLKAAGRTAVYAAIIVPSAILFSLIVAAMLASRVRAHGLFRTVVILPTLMPMTASAMIWLWLLNQQNGLVNRVLGVVGIDPVNWLGESTWVMASMIMIALWGAGQMILVNLAAIREVPRQLYEAAALDGMGPVSRCHADDRKRSILYDSLCTLPREPGRRSVRDVLLHIIDV
jgi:multiple sugar transport system permease protein